MLPNLANLDKIAYRKIEILKLLAAQNLPCSASVLSKKLNISGKTLLNYLADLEPYLANYRQHIRLIKTKEGYYLSKKNSFSMNTLYYDIEKETLFYSFFSYNFHYQNETIDSYAKKQFVSYSYLYRHIRLMNQLLKPFKISYNLSPLKLNGSEVRIRFFAFLYYFHTCNGIAWPFHLVSAQKYEPLIGQLEQLTFQKLSLIQKEKLRYWLAICETRYILEDYIDYRETLYQKVAEHHPLFSVLQPLIDNFLNKFTIPNETNESYFLFFIIQNILKIPTDSLLHIQDEPIVKKTTQFLENIKVIFPKIHLSSIFKEELLYLMYSADHLGDSYIHFLEKPTHSSTFTYRYEAELTQLFTKNKCSRNNSYYFQDSVTKLIETQLATENYQPQIKILVVTKLDNLQKRSLLQKLNNLPFQLLLTEQTEENVDLILSDFYLNNQSTPTFYWNSLPLENDWTNLIETLQNFEKQKIETY